MKAFWSRVRYLGVPIALSILAVTAFAAISLRYSQFVSNTSWTDRGKTTNSIAFPFSIQVPALTEFSVSMTLDRGLFTPLWVKIIPDDGVTAMRINGTNVDLSGINGLNDWTAGFDFPLGKYLLPGKNRVDIELHNNGGNYGITVSSSLKDAGSLLFHSLLGASLMLLVFFILKCAGVELKWNLILIAGLAVRLVYLFVTPWSLRGHDVTGHIDYVEQIVSTHMLPSADKGFMFYHPPLYYILSSVVYSAAQFFSASKNSIYGLLQAFSLAIFFSYMVAALAILKRAIAWLRTSPVETKMVRIRGTGIALRTRVNRFTAPDLLITLSFALFVFWPSNVIHSVRIGNDVLLYLLYALGLLFVMRWNESGGDRSLYLSAMFASLAVMTKTNALILMALIGALIVIRYLYEKDKLKAAVWSAYLKKGVLVGLIFLAGLAVAFGPTVLRGLKGGSSNILVANVSGLDRNLYVGNTLFNYIFLDVNKFLAAPFTSPWADDKGRQSFWNYLLKTSLFGEFSFNSAWLTALATMMSFLFLLLLAFSAGGIALTRKPDVRAQLPLLLNFILLIAGAILFRISIPAAPSNDFRYILPATVSFCFYFVLSFRSYQKKGWNKTAGAGAVTGVLFAALSVVFFLTLFINQLVG